MKENFWMDRKIRNMHPLDYSDKSNWVRFENNGNKKADLLFIYTTIVMTSKNKYYAEINEMAVEAEKSYLYHASVFSDYCNVYMPYYRQIPFEISATFGGDYFKCRDYFNYSIAYKDVEAFLDFYFENCNNGKPYILAGHSQGSHMILIILSKYMKKHPEYLENMVAAYSIGIAPTREMFTKNKSLKFANKEDDTGVVVSWTTEGPNAKGNTVILPKHPMVINPLTWSRDCNYAPKEMNHGSLMHDGTVGEGIADAQINKNRGTVICTTFKKWTIDDRVFATESLHTSDYKLYYQNIRENAKKRIDAFIDKKR